MKLPTTHYPLPTTGLFLLIILLIPFWGFSQEGKGIFLEGYNKADLTPVTQTQDGKYIKLQFSDPQLTSIFENFKILKYENAFDGLDLCLNSNLDQVFALTLDVAIDKDKLTRSSLIKKVEFIPQVDLASGELPIDYYIPTFDESNQFENPSDSMRNDYLDLIDAPCAWKLTTGSPNVLVGVADSGVMASHEELQGKFEALLGDHGTGNKHGTEVAGLIAGKTDNINGTASIGWNTKMVSTPFWSSYTGVRDLAIWSHEHNDKIRVINMSWAFKKESNKNEYTILKRFYSCISNKYNILLVAAGGNKKQCGNPGNDNSFDYYCYPASFESVVSVTAVGSRYPNTSNADSLMQDVLYWNNAEYQGRHLNHMNLNDSIDIAAPGYNLYRPTKKTNNINNTYTKYGRGTSLAAPIVSGTAALMFDVNPNLTPIEVKEILKQTAERIDTIPQNTEYLPAIAGLRRLNAYKAVKMAKYFDEYGFDFDSMPRKVDLMIRDNEEDIGEEPNETTEIFWNSPDIWVRNQPDGIEEYENVEYDPNGQSYVYVRVKNIGCDPSSENDQLKLYWTKAASSMSWPEDYMGTEYIQPGNALKGDIIGTVNIPSIKPGEETILEIPWSNVPNPDDYELINDQPWHYCLLARIESDDDPMTIAETSSIRYNDEQNNNIASKNLTVVNLNPNNMGVDLGGGFGFPNPLGATGYFDLELTPDNAETGKAIFNEAEVRVTLDQTLIDAWEAGGNLSTDLLQLSDGLFLVTGENAALENIKLDPGEFGVVQLQFNFLTKEITEKENYLYHAIQRNSVDNKIMGGESYQINKSPRPLFHAVTSGNKIIDKEEEVMLNAELIGEPAAYNWYDHEGNLIYEGVDFGTFAEIGKQYKLEVVTLSDGYKDYAEVVLNYKPNRIISLSPNPTLGEVEVEYKINEGESAYLAITSVKNPNISNNYMLDIEESAFNLNVGNLSTGIYSVALIVNGQIVDTKNLIKN